jgi:predicted RNA-binding protein with PUA-like domain
MKYWLMKSEPDEFGIVDLERAENQTTVWYGVRNYQVRNFMRDQMAVGDLAFFYHSSCAVPGIAGVAEITTPAYPDASQFDPESKYYDPQAKIEQPRWLNVDVKLVKKTRLMSLTELKQYPELATMPLLARGNRLSVTPVSTAEWAFINSKL